MDENKPDKKKIKISFFTLIFFIVNLICSILILVSNPYFRDFYKEKIIYPSLIIGVILTFLLLFKTIFRYFTNKVFRPEIFFTNLFVISGLVFLIQNGMFFINKVLDNSETVNQDFKIVEKSETRKKKVKVIFDGQEKEIYFPSNQEYIEIYNKINKESIINIEYQKGKLSFPRIIKITLKE